MMNNKVKTETYGLKLYQTRKGGSSCSHKVSGVCFKKQVQSFARKHGNLH